MSIGRRSKRHQPPRCRPVIPDFLESCRGFLRFREACWIPAESHHSCIYLDEGLGIVWSSLPEWSTPWPPLSSLVVLEESLGDAICPDGHPADGFLGCNFVPRNLKTREDAKRYIRAKQEETWDWWKKHDPWVEVSRAARSEKVPKTYQNFWMRSLRQAVLLSLSVVSGIWSAQVRITALEWFSATTVTKAPGAARQRKDSHEASWFSQQWEVTMLYVVLWATWLQWLQKQFRDSLRMWIFFEFPLAVNRRADSS